MKKYAYVSFVMCSFSSNTLRAVLEEGAVGVGYGNRTGTIATIRNLVPEQKHLTLQAVVLKRGLLMDVFVDNLDAPVPSGDGMTIQVCVK